MPRKKMVEVAGCDLYISCLCGIIWKIPLGYGTGLCTYDFQCDGPKGCNRYINVKMNDNRLTSVLGVDKWWLKEDF